MKDHIKIFTGNSNRPLAEKICRELGVKLGNAYCSHFPDGETQVKINENVRGLHTFVIQSTCSPVNESLMEMLIMTDALRRASAEQITAVIPYFGYARQDRKDQPRVPITAKLVANLLTSAGVTRVITIDLHAGQIQGFFDIPLDHLFAVNIFVDYFKKKKVRGLVVVSPDVGGIKTARSYAKRFQADLAIVDKRRVNGQETEVMNILGEVKGKNAVIVDDMISTAGSLIEAVDAIKAAGARDIYAVITHGVLVGPAIERIRKCRTLKELIITDTIPLTNSKKLPAIKQLSVAGLLAAVIQRNYEKKSISELFN